MKSRAGLSGHLAADRSKIWSSGIVVNPASQRTPRGYDLIQGATDMNVIPISAAGVGGKPSTTKPRGPGLCRERQHKAGDKTAARSIVPFRSINDRRNQS